MRALVIRAEPAASRTALKLRNLGHEAVVLPMVKRQCIADFNINDLMDACGFVVTSANALICLAERQLETVDIFDKTIFCVGERTAEQARQTGFRRIISGHQGSSALVKPIQVYQQKQCLQKDISKPLVYLTTKNRNPDLEILLKNLNICLKTVLVYDIIADYCKKKLKSALQYENIDIVLFYAASAVQIFFANEAEFGPELFTGLQYGCLSNEIASAIPDKYANQIIIAKNPQENCLLACIGQQI